MTIKTTKIAEIIEMMIIINLNLGVITIGKNFIAMNSLSLLIVIFVQFNIETYMYIIQLFNRVYHYDEPQLLCVTNYH